MIIRHAEKPGNYGGQPLSGVSFTADHAGEAGKRHLATLGWQRAGALITLFVPPWGPKPGLATPGFLFASNPERQRGDVDEEGSPSHRPFETLMPIAAKLGIEINAGYQKDGYDAMVADALTKIGTILIAWQHEDIPLLNKLRGPGMSQSILTQTNTPQARNLGIPEHWPKDSQGQSRYDLIWVFDLSPADGTVATFNMYRQSLLSSDEPGIAS
jgi:hypothetical protein